MAGFKSVRFDVENSALKLPREGNPVKEILLDKTGLISIDCPPGGVRTVKRPADGLVFQSDAPAPRIEWHDTMLGDSR